MAEAAKMPERTVYEAGAGRKTFLSLAFLILLPFYVSIPAMLVMRLMHGLWFDTIELIVLGLAFTALMALLAVQLYHALRSRVELGDTSVKVTLPQGSGATPMLRFVNKEIPYDQIQAVETRCVLFGKTFAPVLLRSTRLVDKDGQHVRLGNVNEDNIDPALPFPAIGAKIAERAGVNVIDGGMVRRSIERRIMGFIGRKTAIEDSPQITEVEMKEINGRHQRAMKYVVAAMALLVLGGIVVDIFVTPRTSYATLGASAPSKR
jgi:hypothetical protein